METCRSRQPGPRVQTKHFPSPSREPLTEPPATASCPRAESCDWPTLRVRRIMPHGPDVTSTVPPLALGDALANRRQCRQMRTSEAGNAETRAARASCLRDEKRRRVCQTGGSEVSRDWAPGKT
nr:hypothetical protein CFP56_02924 [Quercus suber]